MDAGVTENVNVEPPLAVLKIIDCWSEVETAKSEAAPTVGPEEAFDVIVQVIAFPIRAGTVVVQANTDAAVGVAIKQDAPR
jgi:hypothetical protein